MPRLALLVLAMLAVLPNVASAAVPNGPSPDLVVSQVYGGGGNAGATYKQDYVEIFNRGTASAPLGGLSLQYASTAGTGNLGANAGQLTELPAVTLLPGQYFLVQESPGAGGTVDVPADFVDPTPINMSGTAGKVALARGVDSLGCNTAPTCAATGADTRIVDLVGYGGATYFEGAGPAPATTNTTADPRLAGGCQDTDSNAADFVTAAPQPRNRASERNFCSADQAPFVAATTPAANQSGVPVDQPITVTFSEPVDVAPGAFSLSCTTSGPVPVTVTGAGTTYVVDPDRDLARGETCTLTVSAAGVTDVDEVDPPDAMAADFTVSFTTVGIEGLRIHDIQGAQHRSPYEGALVANVPGIVTATRSNGFWYEDSAPDADVRTSEGVFVFTGGAPPAAALVGSPVLVSGRVSEFRAGCTPTCTPSSSGYANLTTTELVSPLVLPGGPAGAIAPTVVGEGGRVPPTIVIEDDSAADVETSNVFDPAQDGIDFYESLEGMYLRVNEAVVVGPTNGFGEIWVLGDRGSRASLRTPRGGIVIRPGDFNPERIQLDDGAGPGPSPAVDVRDRIPLVLGVLDYDFGNFQIFFTNALAPVGGGLEREISPAAIRQQLAVATLNVENLDPTDGPAKFDRLAHILVDNLRAPDVVAVEEVQDNSGPAADPSTAANVTWGLLIDAIVAAGGPRYDYRQIDPTPNTDGGEPGGNIRQGFLFRTDRGVSFVDRPGGTAVTPNDVVGTGQNTRLLYSPGRIDPLNPAFANSRKPLAAEFLFRGKKVFVIGNHFNSKGGDAPLFGRFQPPPRSSEAQRHEQARIENAFVKRIVAADRFAEVVVLGDVNDFQFSETMQLLKGNELITLTDLLPQSERYTYVFEGNSQALDHILVSKLMLLRLPLYDAVHVNSEFADQASDHDPARVRLVYLEPRSGGGHGGHDDD